MGVAAIIYNLGYSLIIITIRERGLVMYQIGDRVFWNDPDNGLCSGEYTISDITQISGDDPEDIEIWLDNNNCVFAHELTKLNKSHLQS